MKRVLGKTFPPFIAVLLALAFIVSPSDGSAPASAQGPGNNVLQRALNIELGKVQPRPHEARVSSGVVYALLEASGTLAQRAAAAAIRPSPAPFTEGCQNFRFSAS